MNGRGDVEGGGGVFLGKYAGEQDRNVRERKEMIEGG